MVPEQLTAKYGTKANDSIATSLFNLILPYVSRDTAIILTAQALVESRMGKSELAKCYNNFFGVKAKEGGVMMRDLTRVGGKLVSMPARFKVYGDVKESITHRIRMVKKRGLIPKNYAESDNYEKLIMDVAGKWL